MKHTQNQINVLKWKFFILIILAVLPLSCASRTVSVVPAVQPPQEPQKIEPDDYEPTDPFERAYWNVKRNTSLVEKYFEIDSDTPESGTGGTIIIKGKCIFDETEFPVLYDIETAEKTEDGQFRITFLMEDPRGSVSQNGRAQNGVSRGEVARSGELVWKPVPDKTGLLLSFDDEFAQSWRRHFDLLDTFGARVTFFISGGAGTSAEKGLPVFCLEALQRGHCIGYHTLHHYDLTKVTRGVFNSETIEAAQGFRDFGIPLNAFAYPYGFSRDWMHESLAPYFKFTRGFGARFRLYDAAAPASHTVSKSIDNIQYPDDEQFEKHIRLMLLSAKFIGSRIIPFATHDISDNANWGIKPQRLAYMLQTAEELKIRFYTYYDF